MKRIILTTLLIGLVSLNLMGDDKEVFIDAENRFRAGNYELALERYTTLIKEYALSQYTPDAYFRRAVCFYMTGKPDEALKGFKDVASRFYTSRFVSYVPFWVGLIWWDRKNYEDAITYFRKYIESGSEEELIRKALLYKGNSENLMGKVHMAINTFDEYLTRIENPGDNPYVVTLLFSLMSQKKMYAEIVEKYETLKINDFETTWRDKIRLYSAEAYWNLEKEEEAEKIYNELLESQSDIASIAFQRIFLIAQQSENQEKMEKIIRQAEIALAGLPNILKSFWLSIGIVSFKEGKIDLAESYFNRIWDLRSTHEISGSVAIYLAEISKSRGNLDKAISYLETFRDISIDQEELVLLKLGELYLQKGEWAKSEEYLIQVIEYDNEDEYFGQAAYLRSYALYRKGDLNKALAQIQDLFSSAKTGGFSQPLLKMKAMLHKKQNDNEKAIAALKEYLPLNSADLESRINLLKMLFDEEKYKEVLEESNTLLIDFKEKLEEKQETRFLINYLRGLSFITQKKYKKAIEELTNIDKSVLDFPGLNIIYPYALFYRGWAKYRQNEYKKAVEDFAALLNHDSKHELSGRAFYLAGWCEFSAGDFEKAETYFAQIAHAEASEVQFKSSFLLAKSLISQGKIEEAAIAFQNIYLKQKNSPFVDDAIFEHAGLLVELENIDKAAEEYYRLYNLYPESSLSEEGLYKRGEILYGAEKYEESREAFYEYRKHYPEGKLFGAALYWGGRSSQDLGESFGAVLIWEKLISEFKDSPYRSEAIYRTAEIYAENGDYRESLTLYTELIAMYPEMAGAKQAKERAEELRYLILGLSDKEAELSVIIGSEDGANSQKGREALIELSKLYISEGGANLNLAASMLQNVVDKLGDDPKSAAQAQYLIGEYYYRKGNLVRAGNEYLKAATMNPADRDLMASAMYKAAEMILLAGNRAEAEALIQQIESNFPTSEWSKAGRKLLEDN